MNTKITTVKEAPQPLLPLLQGSSTFKLIVPVLVEEKIRYLIRKFPSTEWSGVLFYTHQGSFEQGDLELTCQDLFPMDLGSSGWTEFSMSEDVTAYMAEHIELFDCEMGLIHSHHSMGAFFSGQDNKMLQQEGADTNCFLSLVVDTRGTYVARLTRRMQSKSEVTIHNLGKSYEFFGEGSRELTHDDTITTKTIDKQVIEYFDLQVERCQANNPLAYLDTRFDEILSRKSSSHAKLPPSYDNGSSLPPLDMSDDRNFFEVLHDSHKVGSTSPSPVAKGSVSSPVGKAPQWQPDPKQVHEAVVHIVTCNLILNPNKIDLRQWVTRHMQNVYNRIFGPMSAYEMVNETSGPFTEWKDFIIQFTIDNFDISDAPDAILDDIDLAYSRIAQALMSELSEFLELNDNIQAYWDALSQYVIE